MDAESGRQTTSGSRRRLVAASLAILGVGAIAVAGSAFSAGNANANGEGHVRVARQAGTEPGFVYNGVWYPLNDYEFNPNSNNAEPEESSSTKEPKPTKTKRPQKTETDEDGTTSTKQPKPTKTKKPEKTETPAKDEEEPNKQPPQDSNDSNASGDGSGNRPWHETPEVSKGGANGGKSNVATALPDNLYAGQNGADTSSEGPCSCSGAVIDNTCYATVAQAVGNANSGDTITIGGTKTITDVLGFKTKSLTFEGVQCGGKATLVADMNEPTGAILMATGNNQEVILKNLVFTRASGSGFAAGFRGIRTGQWITLDVQNCDFKNLRTKAMGGSAIYVPLVKGDMSIDGDSTFTSNIVDTKCANMENDKFCEYGGGGALFINEIRKGNSLKLDGTWRDNHHYFQHGLGGAACIEYVEGDLEIEGRFIDNTAADGAGVHIGDIAKGGVVDVDGYFQGNHAIDYGLGSRGAAVRPWFIEGEFNVDGTFIDNVSDGRGGVFASNRVRKSGKVNMKGTYKNNKAYGWGGVLSVTNQFSGDLFIDGSTNFNGNEAYNPNYSILSFNFENYGMGESSWDNQDFVYNGKSGKGKRSLQ